MNKKILLIDADSIIPNIALGKLSTWHKRQGDTVEFTRLNLPYFPNRKKYQHHIETENYDKVYCSVIFEKNYECITGNDIIFGGTGFDLKTKLDDKIENCEVDYSLFPENKISYGFISRGCIRNCYFCKVPEKEGMIHQVNNVDDVIRHKRVKFLDNNILALPNHKEILNELVEKKIRCQFNQGLDIRLLDKENSQLLSKLNYMGEYIFALDSVNMIPLVQEKLKLLGWAKEWQLKFFVYINPKMLLWETITRIIFLRKIKALPYIMRDISCWDSEHSNFYIDLAAWTNQVHLFKKMTFEQFLNKRHTNKERIKNSLNLLDNQYEQNKDRMVYPYMESCSRL